MEFDAAADELYGVAPADFVATRKRLAGELPRDDARRLTALRRPTVPAWAVNLLVRHDAIGPLLGLGERMREAWSSGGDLVALDRERAALVDDLVRRSRDLAEAAGRPLSDAFADEVANTLHAAVADPAAAGAVRAGRLDRPLRYVGFGPFGGARTTASPPTSERAGTRTRRSRRASGQDRHGDEKRREEAERHRQEEEFRRLSEEARAAVRHAENTGRVLAQWSTALDRAKRDLATAEERMEDLRAELKTAEDERAALDQKVRVTLRRHERAARADKDARRRVTDAERGLAAGPGG